jgi:pimeloyl-ACP methyl ester carboxylesterase
MEIKQFFLKDLSSIKKPILLTASLDDELFKIKLLMSMQKLNQKYLTAQSHYFTVDSPCHYFQCRGICKNCHSFIKSAAG